MHEFYIKLRSMSDVLDFVSTATTLPFDMLVGNNTQFLNAKSFMGISSLNLAEPQRVRVKCGEEEFENLLSTMQAFLAS
jgi:phosphotransferase system HPr-like phosphotransfer protein